MDLSTKISTCTISTLPSTEEPTFQPTQDEGVLHDILSELDKERTLRAELEQTVRNLTSNSALPDEGEERAKVELSFLLSSLNVDTTASPSSPSSAPASAISPTAEATSSATISSLHDENATLHSKVSSLQSLLSQLTSSSDAIKLAREDGEASLGVPVITVLETAPWQGVEDIQGLEECYEWEGYEAIFSKWSNRSGLPAGIKSLPLDPAAPVKKFLEKSDATNITDVEVTSRTSLNAFAESTMQVGGEWEWVGGWRFDKDVFGCDGNGWVYGRSIDEITEEKTESCIGKKKEFKVRRRKWTRLRVLTNYPGICERTRQYLQLVLHSANLNNTCTTLSDQVLTLHVKGTEDSEKVAAYDTMKSREKLAVSILDSLEGGETEVEHMRAGLDELRVLFKGGGGAEEGGERAGGGEGGDFFKRIGRGAIIGKVRESLGGIKAAIDDNQARTREKIKVKEEQNRKRSGSGGSNASLDLNLMEDEVDFTTTL